MIRVISNLPHETRLDYRRVTVLADAGETDPRNRAIRAAELDTPERTGNGRVDGMSHAGDEIEAYVILVPIA